METPKIRGHSLHLKSRMLFEIDITNKLHRQSLQLYFYDNRLYKTASSKQTTVFWKKWELINQNQHMSYFHENVQTNLTKISTYGYLKIFLSIWKSTENEKIRDVHTFNYEQIPTLILCQGGGVQAGKQEHKPK